VYDASREELRERHLGQAKVSGTEGYAEEAEDLFKRYESIAAAETHKAVLHLIPTGASHVLDVGAGTGRDAAWLASMGHRVTAVEPTEPMRLPAMKLHPSPLIEWLDDSLPGLALVRSRGELFDLILLSAVWMHFDAAQRRAAMASLTALLRTGGTLIMRVRHGEVPPGRRMFEIADEDRTCRRAWFTRRIDPARRIRASGQPRRRGQLDPSGIC